MSKLVVFTIVARVDDDDHPENWSVYAIDSKCGWYDDIVEYNVLPLESADVE